MENINKIPSCILNTSIVNAFSGTSPPQNVKTSDFVSVEGEKKNPYSIQVDPMLDCRAPPPLCEACLYSKFINIKLVTFPNRTKLRSALPPAAGQYAHQARIRSVPGDGQTDSSRCSSTRPHKPGGRRRHRTRTGAGFTCGSSYEMPAMTL